MHDKICIHQVNEQQLFVLWSIKTHLILAAGIRYNIIMGWLLNKVLVQDIVMCITLWWATYSHHINKKKHYCTKTLIKAMTI